MGQQQAKGGEYASVGVCETNEEDSFDNNNLTFVFHEKDGDSDERVVHDQAKTQRDPADEPGWTIYKSQQAGGKLIIGSRRRFPPCQPLENFVKQLDGPHLLEIAVEDNVHEWLLFLDESTIFAWHDGLLSQLRASQMTRKCRIVTDLYNPIGQRKAIPEEVRARVGSNSTPEFSNSESWCCWCLYGDEDFSAKRTDNEKREYHVQWNDINVGESFRTLDEAITAKRQHERGGLANLQKHFGVRVAHKGLVTCIQ